MADDYEDDENDTADDTTSGDDTSDSEPQQGIPTENPTPAPISEEEQTQSQYQNPMLNAPRPAPGAGAGSALINRILQYARDTFTPVAQQVQAAMPTPLAPEQEVPEAIPTEFGPEAKKHVEDNKDFGQITSAARANPEGIYTPLTREPEGPPIPKEILEGKLSASATTQAAVENAVDPSMQKPASVRAAEAINYTADKAGLQGGLGMLQRYRNNYNTARAFADVAFENDNMESAIAAANRAYSSVPGLNNITFSQGKNGLVTAYVTDDNNHTSAYNLAPHQFKQLLGGPAGDFDGLLKNNAAGVEALGRKSDRTFNASGQEMVPAPKIIFPRTEKEREFDRKQAADEEAATTAHERQKELIRARGDEAERRERAKTEGIRGTKEEQNASRERIAETNRLAKIKSLDDQMKQAVNKMLADGKSQKEIALYKKRFAEENGLAAPPEQPTQRPKLPVDATTGKVLMYDSANRPHWVPPEEAARLLGQ